MSRTISQATPWVPIEQEQCPEAFDAVLDTVGFPPDFSFVGVNFSRAADDAILYLELTAADARRLRAELGYVLEERKRSRRRKAIQPSD